MNAGALDTEFPGNVMKTEGVIPSGLYQLLGNGHDPLHRIGAHPHIFSLAQ
jgi:hypothetical protein